MRKTTYCAVIGLSCALATYNSNVFGQRATTSPQKTANSSGKAPKTEREKFDPTANPQRDLAAAITKAKKGNKRIILDVGGEWCGWCREMDNFLIRSPELQKLRDKNYVWLKINFSDENPNQDFLAAYPKIQGYPHIFVLEKGGKLIYSKDTAKLEDGGKSYDLRKFRDFLIQYSPKKSAAK